MYLSKWKSDGPKENAEMHGFGAFYCHTGKYKGAVYIGEWKDGECHGSGKQLWLESAPCWKDNRLDGSAILENETGLPYVYSGTYDDDGCFKQDESATVTLKDGTTRVRPWKSRRPVGDWWKDHKLVTAATTTQQSDPSALVVKSEEAATAPTASTRASRSSTAKQQKSPPREASVLNERKPSARPAKRAKNEYESVHPPQVISLQDSDDSDTGDQAGPTAAAAVPNAAMSSSQEQAPTDEKEERVKEIREWLVKIGSKPLHEEMDAYARKFIALGLQSVEMIVKWCNEEDIAGFDWINLFHKRWIAAALGQE